MIYVEDMTPGAELDLWVCAAIPIPENGSVVMRQRGRPCFEYEFDPEGPANEFDNGEWKMWRVYSPSRDAQWFEHLEKHAGNYEAKRMQYSAAAHQWTVGVYDPRSEFKRATGHGATLSEAMCKALVIRRFDVAVPFVWFGKDRRDWPAMFDNWPVARQADFLRFNPLQRQRFPEPTPAAASSSPAPAAAGRPAQPRPGIKRYNVYPGS